MIYFAYTVNPHLMNPLCIIAAPITTSGILRGVARGAPLESFVPLISHDYHQRTLTPWLARGRNTHAVYKYIAFRVGSSS